MRLPDVFTLDYNHPLAQGLSLCGIAGATGLVDESFRHAVFTRTGLKPKLFEDGTRMDLASVAGNKGLVTLPNIGATQPFSVSWKFWRKTVGISNTFGRFLEGPLGTVYNKTGPEEIRFEAQILGYPTNLNYTIANDNAIHTLTALYLPSSLELYYDGVFAASVSGTKTALSGSTYILNRAAGDRTFDGAMGDILFHSRALSRAEIAILADRTDPMLGGLVREVSPVAYFDFGASEPTVITGTMSATESGTDTFAATGQLLVSGIMSVTESGSDTIAASGAVLIQGTLSATEIGADTFAAYGGAVAPITGTMAVTETEHDTATIVGQLLVSGLMNVSEVGDDFFAAIGGVTDTAPITAAEVARTVIATPRMKTVTASQRVKQVRYEVTRA